MKEDKDKFEVTIDVSQFRPEELKVWGFSVSAEKLSDKIFATYVQFLDKILATYEHTIFGQNFTHVQFLG
jgi:hypothetical protein